MTAENVGQTAGLSIAGFTPWGAGKSSRERNFYIALAVAVFLHALFFIHAAENAGTTKQLGAENGADDGISVSLVTEQDLKSKATVADEVSPPPGPIAPTQQQQQGSPTPQEQPKEKQPPTPPQPEQAKEEPQPPEPQQPPPEPQAQETPQPPEEQQPDIPQEADPAKPEPETVAKAEDTSTPSQPPDLFSLDDQDATKPQSTDKPKPKPEPKKETKHEAKKPSTSKAAKKSSTSKAQKKLAALDFSTQALSPSFSGGGGAAAFQRPPGITRSGLNDAFARAVIRALQQSMPQLSNTLGRVTVRIFLSDSGNVVSVNMLAGSKDPSLNQDVVFAAKQTSYPIPPAGSNEADRTFMVTYIYD